MKYILAAIDGTSSSSWIVDSGGSSTYRFFDRFETNWGRKEYFPGPNDGMTGGDCEDIVLNVIHFILHSYYEILQSEQSRAPQIKVFLVGHSRGGYIAIRAAAAISSLRAAMTAVNLIYLSAVTHSMAERQSNVGRVRQLIRSVEQSLEGIGVSFMGLYDAVDRTGGVSTEVITNVQNVFHARRNPAIGSRGYFDNTGLRVSGDGRYTENFFMTSHGGIGGAHEPHASGSWVWLPDITCRENYETLVNRGRYHLRTEDPVGTRESLCASQSVAAEQWIWRKAMVCR